MIRPLTITLMSAALLYAQTDTHDKPTWWNKYQALLQGGADHKSAGGTSLSTGAERRRLE